MLSLRPSQRHAPKNNIAKKKGAGWKTRQLVCLTRIESKTGRKTPGGKQRVLKNGLHAIDSTLLERNTENRLNGWRSLRTKRSSPTQPKANP